MKKNKLIYLIIFLIGVSIFFLVGDRHNFYFGKSYFRYTNILPYGIVPKYNKKFEGGPSLLDKYGMQIIGKHSLIQYDSSQGRVRQLIKYGIKGESVFAVVELEDTMSNVYLQIIPVSTDICLDCLQTIAVDSNILKKNSIDWYTF